MENKQYSQQLSSERNGKQSQSLRMAYSAQVEEGDEGGLELGELVAAIRRKIFIVASVTIAVASATVALAVTNTPTYEAKFELLTEPVTVENKLTTSPLNKETEEQSSGVDATELRILQSPKLMFPIIQQIEARYPGSGLPQLNIRVVDNTRILEVSYQNPDPEKVRLVLDIVSDAYLRYSLEERRADISLGVQFVENQLPQLQQRVEVLQAKLQKFRQQHDLIDPEGQGQQLSSQLSAIVQQRLETRIQLAKTRSFYTALQNQLGLQPNQATAASALSEAPRYQSLLNQLQELERKIAVESARYREDSPTIQALRDQKQNLLPILEQEGRLILGNKPSNITGEQRGLASQNSIRLQQTQQLFDTTRQIQVLETQNKALAEAERSLRQQVKEFPVLTRINDDLVRQLEIAIENLNQFLIKREALRIDAAQKQVPWQLLTPHGDPQPSSVSVKRNLVLGTVLGLLLGVGVALVVDKFSNVFYTPEGVRNKTRLPLLGEIPFIEEHKKFASVAGVAGATSLIEWVRHKFKLDKRGKSQQHNVSHFWEALRSLYTNIRFVSFDAPVRSLTIISASTEDGRSTIAVNLAQTAAAMGKRVLLVDADLRSPKLHTMLDLPNINGLSNVIAEDLDFKDFIQRSCSVSMKAQDDYKLSEAAAKNIGTLLLEDNFFVLTAGQVPPNPTSLLSSHKMQNLIEQFQETFDLIIFDTSPFLGLADSSLLAIHTDASILVVGLGKTKYSVLLKALEGLRISSIPVLGVVANGLKGNMISSHVTV